jgi:hypothetical protein
MKAKTFDQLINLVDKELHPHGAAEGAWGDRVVHIFVEAYGPHREQQAHFAAHAYLDPMAKDVWIEDRVVREYCEDLIAKTLRGARRPSASAAYIRH